MKNLALAMWKEEEGFLTFEWILLITLLTIGIVSGLTAVRDATIEELGDVAQAMLSLDQSFTISSPLKVWVHQSDISSGASSSFTDQFPDFNHCSRTGFHGVGPVTDCGTVGTAP
ncbi:MAG: hypothetical protein K8T25_22005 [Planctomycetia bacterium]|nr:hypothetical protein [Planctomycetia bacterium]